MTRLGCGLRGWVEMRERVVDDGWVALKPKWALAARPADRLRGRLAARAEA